MGVRWSYPPLDPNKEAFAVHQQGQKVAPVDLLQSPEGAFLDAPVIAALSRIGIAGTEKGVTPERHPLHLYQHLTGWVPHYGRAPNVSDKVTGSPLRRTVTSST